MFRALIFMRTIELSKQGNKHKGKYFAQVSDEDYEAVSKIRWYPAIRNYTTYAIARIRNPFTGKKFQIQLHRFILGITDETIIVDHKDGDGLNCRRDNIRIATRSQNAANVRKNIGTSKYMGVYWRASENKWIARVRYEKKSYYVGKFDNELEAAIARDKKAKEIHGDFARLNFPT
jgi:hypothetical protein